MKFPRKFCDIATNKEIVSHGMSQNRKNESSSEIETAEQSAESINKMLEKGKNRSCESVGSGGNKFSDRFVKVRLIYSMSKNDTYKLSNTSKKQIGFNGAQRIRFAPCGTKRVFQNIDSTFYQDPVTVKVVPMFSVARKTWIEPEVFIRIGIYASAIWGIGARGITGTYSFRWFSDFGGFVTDVFKSFWTVRTAWNAKKGKRSFVNGADWSAAFIEVRVGIWCISMI